MKRVTFTADVVDFSAAAPPDVVSVLLANPGEEQVVLFSRTGDGASYVERDDQSLSTYDGVKAVTLATRAVHVELNAAGKRALKCEGIDVELQLTTKETKQLRSTLATIFDERLTVAKTTKTTKDAKKRASGAKPARDVSQARYLNLQEKKLMRLPPEVATMTALETAKLERNPALDLVDAFAVLATLPALRSLALTPMTTLPAGLGALANLEELSLDGLTTPQSLPASLGELRKLRQLSLFTTAEFAFPPAIGKLTELERLAVSAPSWTLPQSFFRLENIKELSLSRCDAKGSSPDLATMRKLEKLYLSDPVNLDVGAVLRSAWAIETLVYLQLSASDAPAEVGGLRALKELRIVASGKGQLAFPSELWSLRSLERLDLGGNRIARLPAEIGELEALKELSLFACDVDTLPSALGDLPALEVLNVVQNPRLRDLPASLVARTGLKIYR